MPVTPGELSQGTRRADLRGLPQHFLVARAGAELGNFMAREDLGEQRSIERSSVQESGVQGAQYTYWRTVV